ncbi:Trehalose utilization protein [Nakamurella panacisegetis]|uniref:Trehalose utilization protein n=1 Tax=Nakamurella panacisegetis TaxID=1090615 RepID=A0A1H0LI95_9ACTN|nr:ThuA domain-containing protein [Nakamurella panacisegetis]SDO67968.1 Trehalose utilization protein [Nakamurella panacisegetis]
MTRVTVWNEFRHEKSDPEVAAIYPDGMHVTIAEALRARGIQTRTATLDEPEHGLTDAVLDETDVLIWWGHLAHEEVDDAIVERVQLRVLGGMGLVVLHSGHGSKLFRRLMGTTCNLKWRESTDTEVLWNVAPGHPITRGIDEHIIIDQEEMYGEYFEVPTPDVLVFISWFTGGEVFRSGACYVRGSGKIFYFRPGHETYPTYHHSAVQDVIANAARWAAPDYEVTQRFGNPGPLIPR